MTVLGNRVLFLLPLLGLAALGATNTVPQIATAASPSGIVWVGTAHVDVMIWEPGGEHPYSTAFELEYREAGRVAIHGASDTVVAYGIRLLPQRISTRVHHVVRCLLNCSGGGEELIVDGPEGQLVMPLSRREAVSAIGVRVPPPGAYQIVLPRAISAFACGTKKNVGDRWVIVGSGLFHPAGDIDAADSQIRALEAGGTRMRGSYVFTDASRRQPVRHDYSVTWDLRRQAPQ